MRTTRVGPKRRPSRRSGALPSRRPQPNARANRLPDCSHGPETATTVVESNSKSRVHTANAETRTRRPRAASRNARLGRAKAPGERKASVERVPTISPRRHMDARAQLCVRPQWFPIGMKPRTPSLNLCPGTHSFGNAYFSMSFQYENGEKNFVRSISITYIFVIIRVTYFLGKRGIKRFI